MRILIIRFSSLGDIILTQPIVSKLHEVFPEAELVYLTKEQYKEIPRHFGIPVKVISNSELRQHYSGLKGKQFAYVFDLQNKLNSFLAKSFCLRARYFTYNKQRHLRQLIVRHKTDKSISSTLDLYQSALLKAAKKLRIPELAEGLNNPVLFPDPDISEQVQAKLKKPADRKIIAMFPGATHFTKMYPAESFVKIIQQAGDKYHFWLLSSNDETELTHRIQTETSYFSTNLGGKFDLNELLAVIASADAVITNDSGPMHMAAALGKLQVAIFGSTHPRLGFKPLNDKAIILSQDVSCQPCALHGREACPRKHFACLLSLKPEQVLEELNNLF